MDEKLQKARIPFMPGRHPHKRYEDIFRRHNDNLQASLKYFHESEERIAALEKEIERLKSEYEYKL